MPYRGDHVCYLTELLGHCCLRQARLRRRGANGFYAALADLLATLVEDDLEALALGPE
ncbi:hypothetical protein [Natronococcus sp.]|uniref:hypothetical protein n=1 Tax=Natronococcus sp. TaxID=35747 RepID=UPI0025CDBB3F|nr:hypothetical protein [Natronococcus sp.]